MLPGTFPPWNESSWELSFPGPKIPGNFRSRERNFPVGTFALWSENTGERKVPEPVIVRVMVMIRARLRSVGSGLRCQTRITDRTNNCMQNYG